MHWLATRIEHLLAIAVPEGLGASEGGRERRRAFLDAVHELVDEVAARDGVTAAFASYEGLVVAAAGAAEFEALAAMAQSAMEPARHTAGVAELGALRQLVLVGERSKLALLRVGPVTVGLLCPSGVHLAEATA